MIRIPGYRVEGPVGRGAMGTVFRAVQEELDRPVALKVMAPELADDPEFATRFLHEAAGAARLDHPGIVRIHEGGRSAGGLYYAMEWVDGPSLAERIAGGPLPPTRAAELAREVAEALAHAHGRGIVHRDVKPDNVLIDPDGRARLADFGLARDRARRTLTQAGDALGTPGYMAPEQVDPEGAGEPDGRVDVWALGVTLSEMLTGSRPFEGKNAYALAREILYDEPSPPSASRPAVPDDLDRIVARALAKSPDDRYPTARALADDLRRFLDGERVKARGPSLPRRAWRAVRRRPDRVIAAVLVLLVAAGAGGAWLLAERGREATRERIARRALEEAWETVERLRARSGSDPLAPAELGSELESAWTALDRAAEGLPPDHPDLVEARDALQEVRVGWLDHRAGEARTARAIAIVEAALEESGNDPEGTLRERLRALGGLGTLEVTADGPGRVVVRPADGGPGRTAPVDPGRPARLELAPGRYAVEVLGASPAGPVEVEVRSDAEEPVRVSARLVRVRSTDELRRALAEAGAGQTIHLAPGRYEGPEGPFEIDRPGLRLLGDADDPPILRGGLVVGAPATVRSLAIEGTGEEAALRVEPEASDTRLERLTVRGAATGLRVDAPRCDLRHLRIQVEPRGVGLHLEGPAPLACGVRIEGGGPGSVGFVLAGPDGLLVDAAVVGTFWRAGRVPGDRATLLGLRVEFEGWSAGEGDGLHIGGDRPRLISARLVNADTGIQVGHHRYVAGPVCRHVTTLGCGPGIRFGRLAVRGRITDCVLADPGTTRAGIDARTPLAESDRNVGPVVPARFGDYRDTAAVTLGTWRARTGQDANSVAARPEFRDRERGDLRLRATSPGAGTAPGRLDAGWLGSPRRLVRRLLGSDEPPSHLEDVTGLLEAVRDRPALAGWLETSP